MTADPAPESGSRNTRIRFIRDAVAADLDALAARIARLETRLANPPSPLVNCATPAPPALSDRELVEAMLVAYYGEPGSVVSVEPFSERRITGMLAVLRALRAKGVCR